MQLPKFAVPAALAVLSLALPSAALCSPVDPQPAPTPDGKAKPKDKLDEVVCRSMDETGSHVSRQRVCMSRREWEALTHDAQEAFHYIHERDNYQAPPPGGIGGHH